MKTLSHLVLGLNVSDARSSLYYLSRYLKQASHYEDYGKDIFDDDFRSYPEEAIRIVTLGLIKFIEGVEKIPVSQFDEATYIKWSDHVEEIESGLDPQATATEIEQANSFVSAMSLPNSVKKYNE